MGRTVISQKDIDAESRKFSVKGTPDDNAPGGPAEGSTKKKDKYTERLLKYLPAEVIALYLALDSIVRSSDKISHGVYWGIFVFGIVATFLYLWRIEKVKKTVQLLISTIAFCVWVFALGGPFVNLGWYDPVYGGLLVPIYTFVIAMIEA